MDDHAAPVGARAATRPASSSASTWWVAALGTAISVCASAPIGCGRAQRPEQAGSLGAEQSLEAGRRRAAAGAAPGVGQRVHDPVQGPVVAQAGARRIRAAEDRDQGQPACRAGAASAQLGVGQLPMTVADAGARVDRGQQLRRRSGGSGDPDPADLAIEQLRRSRPGLAHSLPGLAQRARVAPQPGSWPARDHAPVTLRRGAAGESDVVEQRLHRQLGDPVELLGELCRTARAARHHARRGEGARADRDRGQGSEVAVVELGANSREPLMRSAAVGADRVRGEREQRRRRAHLDPYRPRLQLAQIERRATLHHGPAPR